MKEPLRPPNLEEAQLSPEWKSAQLIYILQATGFFVGVTYFIAALLCHLRRGRVQGHWLQTHAIWQMRTFWLSMAGGLAGLVTLPVGIGHFVLIATTLWTVYRIAQGWSALLGNRPMSVTS